ncbi:MAG: hypothetical protein IKU03_08320 [Bacteroidales bacterium]|nr:hypothetical protein [Bacteroidales bacterium]
MFFYFNKNTIIQIIISVGLLGWAFFSIITQMTLMAPDHQAFLYQAIYPFLAARPWCYKALAILITLLTAFFIQRYFSISKFSDNVTYMPIVFFLLLFNLNHSFSIFSPVFFTILTSAFLLMRNTQNEHDPSLRNSIFSSGLFLGINSLLDFHSVWLIGMIILVLMITSISKFKDVVILLVGVLFIYLYLVTYGYLTDTIPSIWSVFQDLKFGYIIHNFATLQWLDWIFIAVLGLTLLLFSFAGKIYFDNKIVALRRRYIAFILLIITSITMGIFSNYELPVSLQYLLLPTALIFALTSLIEERKWLHDFFILATFILLWL